jgi:hypothetical protein
MQESYEKGVATRSALSFVSPLSGRRQPAYWPCAVRGTGGVTLALALVELENLFGGDKGKGTSGSPAGPKVLIPRAGADCPVVARKRGNAPGAKGAGHPRRDRFWSTGNRREPAVMAGGGSLQGWHEPCDRYPYRDWLGGRHGRVVFEILGQKPDFLPPIRRLSPCACPYNLGYPVAPER